MPSPDRKSPLRQPLRLRATPAIQLTVNIDVPLRERLTRHAFERGATISHTVRQALSAYLDAAERE